MLRWIIRTVIARRERAGLLILGVLVVSAAFGLLLSTIETARVTIDQNLAQYWRTTYDILVRPKNSRSAIEEKYGQVQSNHLSNIAGGITIEQYQAIRDIPGLEVAAPVAMLGKFDLVFHRPVEVTCEPGFYKLRSQVNTEDGLRTIKAAGAEYFACTHDASAGFRHLFDSPQYNWNALIFYPESRAAGQRPWFQEIVYHFPVLIAAIDPEQESLLVGLDQAIQEGNYFSAQPAPSNWLNPNQNIPILMNSSNYMQAMFETKWQKIDLLFSDETLKQVEKEGQAALAGLSASTIQQWMISSDEAYHEAIQNLKGEKGVFEISSISALPSAVSYQEVDQVFGQEITGLNAVALSAGKYRGGWIAVSMPGEEMDSEVRYRETGFGRGLGGAFSFQLQGIYDIERLPRPNEVNEVPLETYFPPNVLLRYDASGAAIEPVTMRPHFGDEGYITSPPLALTTLDYAPFLNFEHHDAPISAIRVRVSGAEAYTPEVKARIEAVAGEILRRTGLEVDITIGSSSQRRLIYLSGSSNAPAAGYVEEGWVQKGVVYYLARETQRVNLFLFAAMLGVSALYILNTALVSTLARRRELALHKALGWRSDAVFSLALSEGVLVGLVAGSLGLLLAFGLAWLLRLEIPAQTLVWVLPVGLGLCVCGHLLPAILAARTPAAKALRQGEVILANGSKGLPLRFSMPSFALRQALLRPARAILAILTAAASAAFLAFFLSVMAYSRGYMTGTLLGEQILLHVEGYHWFLLAITLLVTSLSIADLLFIAVIERRREIGVLKSLGWKDRYIMQCFLWEAAGLSLSGSVLGWPAGILLFSALSGQLPLTIPVLILPTLILPLLFALSLALLPARQAMRIPPAHAMRFE